MKGSYIFDSLANFWRRKAAALFCASTIFGGSHFAWSGPFSGDGIISGYGACHSFSIVSVNGRVPISMRTISWGEFGGGVHCGVTGIPTFVREPTPGSTFSFISPKFSASKIEARRTPASWDRTDAPTPITIPSATSGGSDTGISSGSIPNISLSDVFMSSANCFASISCTAYINTFNPLYSRSRIRKLAISGEVCGKNRLDTNTRSSVLLSDARWTTRSSRATIFTCCDVIVSSSKNCILLLDSYIPASHYLKNHAGDDKKF
jgi:hypothetical protein